MKRNSSRLLVTALQCLALIGGIVGVAHGAEKEAPKDVVLKGDAKCTRCHDETESYPVLAIGKTRHGITADARTPTCTSCHGESERHANKPADVKERPKPDRTFSGPLINVPGPGGAYLGAAESFIPPAGKRSTTPVEERNAPCIGCHQGGKRMHWEGSTHATRDVACTSCHQVHTQHDKVRDKLTQPEVCFTCHKEQRAQVGRLSHHPIKEGKVACSDCHNPHGSAGPKLLARDSVNDTCYTCHMEKRGPFVHNHQPVTEDCSICHNPHGSPIANLLKARPPFLCQECHSHTSHPSQASGLPTARTSSTSALGSVGRGCLNCHTNIHGGNSTQNSATAGRFRR
ncbi:MAG: DmsE family decaheme c-type cytochrome [Pseudomonadota bacterium]